jgi:methanethiol S-methyltransferase
MKNLIYLVTVFIAMGAWAVLHSWLAAFSTKAMVQRIFGKGICRYYRLVFIAVAGITLAPILGLVVLLPARVLWRIPTPWLYLTLTLQFLALCGLVLTVLQVDTLAFVGLRQLRNPDAEKDNKLVTRGFYRWVRHPLYFFSLVILWLLPIMTDLSLAFVLASSLYFIVGTVPEERKLVKLYGDPYREYQKTVPRIIPWLRMF